MLGTRAIDVFFFAGVWGLSLEWTRWIGNRDCTASFLASWWEKEGGTTLWLPFAFSFGNDSRCYDLHGGPASSPGFCPFWSVPSFVLFCVRLEERESPLDAAAPG